MKVQLSPNTKAVPPMMVRVRYPRLAVWPFQIDQNGKNGESKQLTFTVSYTHLTLPTKRIV